MSSSELQSHISARRGAVPAASHGDQAPAIRGVLRAVIIALSFWAGVGYLVHVLT